MTNEAHHHPISDEDRAKVALQVDAFIEILARRYGLQPNEVVDAVRWVQHHKEFVSSMKKGGLLSLFGVMVSAMLMTFWEGFKAWARKP